MTKNEKTIIGKSFRNLYEFRSSLVHGRRRKSNDALYTSHLWIGRNLCRKTLLWVIHFLAILQKQTRETDIKISRKDVYSLIDFFRFTEGKFNKYFSELSSNFPYPQEWIE